MPPRIVEFREVTKRFGASPPVLNRISFSATPGEFIAFIGPSGCGKSTLLRLIGGLSEVSGGVLTVEAAAGAARSHQVSFVFQEPTLLPWLTVAENIELPLQLRRIAPTLRAQRRDAVLEWVRLPEKALAYPRQLSGGQKMRVSLARALALEPSLLLLDEPFGALDEMTREHLNEELLVIRQQQEWTTFVVTHSVHEAVFLASRILILSASPGQIHAEVPIPLPYPRTADTRLTAAYVELVSKVTRLLRAVDPALA